MNYTENYQLPQWEETDRILRADFNDSNSKIDTALSTLAADHIALGSYVGNGSNDRTIQLPFPPLFVIILGHYCSGSYNNMMLSVITEDDCRYIASGSCGGGSGYNLLLEGDTLIVQNAAYNNTEGKTVYYIAIR